MASAVLFIGWDRPHTGVGDRGYAYVMGEGADYLRKLRGKYFERLETVALTPHGGDINGCILLFGERAKLDELRRTDEFEAFALKLDELFEGVAVVPGVNWEGMQGVMTRRQKAAEATQSAHH